MEPAQFVRILVVEDDPFQQSAPAATLIASAALLLRRARLRGSWRAAPGARGGGGGKGDARGIAKSAFDLVLLDYRCRAAGGDTRFAARLHSRRGGRRVRLPCC